MSALQSPTKFAGRAAPSTAGRPVLLATLSVPFAPEAPRLAVEAALEADRPLIVANFVRLPPLGMCVNMRYDQLDDPPELAESLRGTAALAHSVAVEVERLRVRSLRPVAALVEVVAESAAGLLVFGPDPRRLRRRAYAKAVRQLRDRCGCLFWIPT